VRVFPSVATAFFFRVRVLVFRYHVPTSIIPLYACSAAFSDGGVLRPRFVFFQRAFFPTISCRVLVLARQSERRSCLFLNEFPSPACGLVRTCPFYPSRDLFLSGEGTPLVAVYVPFSPRDAGCLPLLLFLLYPFLSEGLCDN